MFLVPSLIFARRLPPALVHRSAKSFGPYFRMATMVDNHWTRVELGNGIPPFSVYGCPIKKPDNDEREYRIIRLGNGLQATLVHDAHTDKAAASLDVAVGHLSDPVRLLP